jgi:hypothetical protein
MIATSIPVVLDNLRNTMETVMKPDQNDSSLEMEIMYTIKLLAYTDIRYLQCDD